MHLLPCLFFLAPLALADGGLPAVGGQSQLQIGQGTQRSVSSETRPRSHFWSKALQYFNAKDQENRHPTASPSVASEALASRTVLLEERLTGAAGAAGTAATQQAPLAEVDPNPMAAATAAIAALGLPATEAGQEALSVGEPASAKKALELLPLLAGAPAEGGPRPPPLAGAAPAPARLGPLSLAHHRNSVFPAASVQQALPVEEAPPTAAGVPDKAGLAQDVDMMINIISAFLEHKDAPASSGDEWHPSGEDASRLLVELSRDLGLLHTAMLVVDQQAKSSLAGAPCAQASPQQGSCEALQRQLIVAREEKENLVKAYSQTAASAEQALRESSECARELKEGRQIPGGLRELDDRREAENAQAQAIGLQKEVDRLAAENNDLTAALRQAQQETSMARAQASSTDRTSETKVVETQKLLAKMKTMMNWRHLEALSNRTVAQQREIADMRETFGKKAAELASQDTLLKHRVQETKGAARVVARRFAAADMKIKRENEELLSKVRELTSRVADLDSDKKELMTTLNAAITRGNSYGNPNSGDGNGNMPDIHVHVHNEAQPDQQGRRGGDSRDFDPVAAAQAEASARAAESAMAAAERVVDSDSSVLMRDIDSAGPAVVGAAANSGLLRDLPQQVRMNSDSSPALTSAAHAANQLGDALQGMHANQLLDWMGMDRRAATPRRRADPPVTEAALRGSRGGTYPDPEAAGLSNNDLGPFSQSQQAPEQREEIPIQPQASVPASVEEEPDMATLKDELDGLDIGAAKQSTNTFAISTPTASSPRESSANAAEKLLRKAAAIFR